MTATTFTEAEPAVEQLVTVYRLISEWFLYPEEIDPATLSEEALRDVKEDAGRIDPELTRHLSEFRAAYDDIHVEEYLALLELSPSCPLYLGSYQFAEPTTCSDAGVSERNQYMLEIGNIFRHFGLEIQAELPDFLPAIIEFLALTAGAQDENRDLRLKFIERMVWPGVRLFVKKLEAENTPYLHLAEALSLCLRHEAGYLPEPEPPQLEKKAAQSDLIQLEGVAS